jgi:MOSC domain-containing protein YiiM
MASVRAIQGVGLEGDRYATGDGFWQTVKNPRVAIRHVSLISRNNILKANAELGTAIEASDTRRQLLIDADIDLRTLIKQEFSIGKVPMRGTEECEPCNRPSELSGKPGFETLKEIGGGGLRAEILSSGEIREGDALSLSQ